MILARQLRQAQWKSDDKFYPITTHINGRIENVARVFLLDR